MDECVCVCVHMSLTFFKYTQTIAKSTRVVKVKCHTPTTHTDSS